MWKIQQSIHLSMELQLQAANKGLDMLLQTHRKNLDLKVKPVFTLCRLFFPLQLNVSLSPVSRFTLHAVNSRGGQSESSYVSVRTSCPMVDDSRAEGTAGVATLRPHISFIGSSPWRTRKTFCFPASQQYSYITSI